MKTFKSIIMLGAVLALSLSVWADDVVNAETGLPEYKTSRDIEAMEALLRAKGTKGAGIQVQVAGNIDFQNFPDIKVFTIVADNNGQHIGGISKSYFDVSETHLGTTRALSSFSVTELGAGGVSKADIVFVIDESGSMSDEINSVKTGIKAFADLLSSSGIDYRLGIVSYEGSGSGGIGVGFSSSGFADNTQIGTFKGWVDRIGTQGGEERAYDAIVYACSPPFDYRGDAQQVICLVTDEDNDTGKYTVQNAANSLFGKQFFYFNTGSRSDVESDFNPLGTRLGGAFNEQTLLNRLGSSIVAKYVVEYTSPWPDFDSIKRDVAIKVGDPGNPSDFGIAVGDYTPVKGGVLTGLVTDRYTGNPIVGATLRIGSLPSISDSNGEYAISGITVGQKQILLVSALGYESKIVYGVGVLAGDNPPIDIELVPASGGAEIKPLDKINALAGSPARIEEGGALIRWYRGTDTLTGSKPQPNEEVSVFGRKVGSSGSWDRVAQPSPSNRGGGIIQKARGEFPVYARMDGFNVGDVVEFKVFYPSIAQYSDSLTEIDSFRCSVIDRKYVHGFENKDSVSFGGKVLAGLDVNGDFYQSLYYDKTSQCSLHKRLVVSKAYARGLSAGVGASVGASFSVNGQHVGASASAAASETLGLFARNDYEYKPSDTSISSAIAKLYLYYSPCSPEFTGGLDPIIAQFLSYLSGELEKSKIETPWVYGSAGVSVSGSADASATAGAGLIGGNVDVSAKLYGKLTTGELVREKKQFSELEVGAGWSGGANAMAVSLQPSIGHGSGGSILQSVGIAADASRSDTVFARVTIFDEQLCMGFGRRTQAGASYKAGFYDNSRSGSTSVNEKILAVFTVSANKQNIKTLLSNYGLLKDSGDYTLTGAAVKDLFKVIANAKDNPLFDVSYENTISTYETISANDVELVVGLGIEISGSYSGEFNQMTEFVSERGVWDLGSLYLMEDYNEDTRYHLKKDTGSSSVIPTNNQNISDVSDGPQDWVGQISSSISQMFTSITKLIQSGVEVVFEYEGFKFTLRPNALPGSTQLSVDIWNWIDSHNPFTKGSGDDPLFGISGYFKIGEDGVVLQTASEIILAYTDAEVAGWDENSLAVYRFDSNVGKWIYSGGVVDAANNKVTADITVLGTYALAATFPYDDITVMLSPNSIDADGVSISDVQTDIIMLNNGSIVPDGTLVTIASSLGTIQVTDADSNLPGVQLTSTGGSVQFKVVASQYGGASLVSAETVAGVARGSAELEFVDTTPPAAPSGITATPFETSVEVAWNAAMDEDVVEYFIHYREGIPGPPYDGKAGVEGVNSPVLVSGLAENSTILGMSKDRPYYIVVSAMDASGNESDLSDAVMVRTAEMAPRPVPQVVINNLQSGSGVVELRWAPSPDDFYGAQDVVTYEIHRVDTDTGMDIVLNSVNAGNLVYMDSGVNNPGNVIQTGINYEYYIRAIDGSGNYSDSPTASLFVVGVILDVTADVVRTPIGWELDPSTGALLATIRIENNAGKNGVPLKDAFWYAIEEGSNILLANPSGETNGLVYVDVTSQVEAQLPNIGDGDMELDVGESVTFVIAIYTRDRSIPTGHVYGIWADPPIGEELLHALDVNGDNVIDDFEILDAVDEWNGGGMDDFGLLEAIQLWKAGGYALDDATGKFVPVE